MELRVSYSSLETFKSCPRKFYFSKVFMESGLRPIGQRNPAMSFGSFMHHALALVGWYHHEAYPYLKELFDNINSLPDTERQWMDIYPIPLAKQITAEFMLEHEHIHKDMTAVEVWAEHNLLDTPTYKINLVGILDGIKGSWENIWVVEHKTTSWSPELFLIQSCYSIQWKIYCYLAEKALGFKPRGVIYNLVSMNKQKTKHKIEQRGFDQTSATLRTVEDYLRLHLGQLTFCIENNFWPESGGCFFYNRVCEYRNLCNFPDPLNPPSIDGFERKEDYV